MIREETVKAIFEHTREGALGWNDITQGERDHWNRAIGYVINIAAATAKQEVTKRNATLVTNLANALGVSSVRT